MKKIKLFTILIIPFMFLIFLGASGNSENTKLINQDENINNDIFYSGIYFENNGNISGNLFIKSQKSLINGTIDGNIFIYSDNVQLNGHVTGDIFIFSNDVVVTGKIDGNIYILATNQVVLETTSEVARSSYIISNDILLYGEINRDAKIFAVNEITVKGLISGNLLYSAKTSNIAANGVKGNVEVSQFLTLTDTLQSNSFTKIILLLSYIFTNLVIWFLLNFIFKETKVKAAIILKGNKFKLFFVYGILSMIVSLFGAFLLMMSNVSLAFGLMLLAIVASLMYLSSGVFIVIVSDYISLKKNILKGGNNIILVLLFSFLFGLLLMLPIFGVLFGLIIEILGFGLLMGSFFIKLKYIEKGQIID